LHRSRDNWNGIDRVDGQYPSVPRRYWPVIELVRSIGAPLCATLPQSQGHRGRVA
jgi:hypothetical protein